MATGTTATAARLLPIPVLLLKTKSSPRDIYDELFASSRTGGNSFEPIFVPVLEHCLDDDGVARLRDLLVRRRIQRVRGDSSNGTRCGNSDVLDYGGLIFTSQRAVEAFAKVVAQGSDTATRNSKETDGNGDDWPHLQNVPIYSVGPATTRGLRAVPQLPPLQVSGDHTGNGEDLAHYIREHYVQVTTRAEVAAAAGATTTAKVDGRQLPPLLFVVGEKRRDAIPKVLMGDGAVQHIRVDELVVYGTSVMESFPEDLRCVLDVTRDRAVRWFVVFSPTGCDCLLASLGLLDPDTGRAYTHAHEKGQRRTYIATIGPTTRAHLRDCFGFEPDVCASEPTPQGIMQGIRDFMAVQPIAATAELTVQSGTVNEQQT